MGDRHNIARANEILRSHGIKMIVGGCGCCGSPQVEFEYGDLKFEAENCLIDTTDMETPKEAERIEAEAIEAAKREARNRDALSADMSAYRKELQDRAERAVADGFNPEDIERATRRDEDAAYERLWAGKPVRG